MTIGKPHIITVSDAQRGIQWIAAYYMGDVSEWTTLVQLNQLTPPYVTSDPSQVYGPPVAITSLSQSVEQGADTIPLLNYPQSITNAYISTVGPSGIIAEAVAVENYDGQQLTLATPLQHSYPVGSSLQLFSDYQLQNKVLLPGDVIFFPVDTESLNFTDNQELVDAFGTDIANPIQFANGDIALVSGLDTLLQRMRIALQTEIGSLPLHPQFGSALFQSIGTPTNSIKWTAVVSTCLTQLPEVDSVSNVTVNVNGTTAYVSATVNVSTSDAPIQLINEPFTIVSAPTPINPFQ